jgi:membrane-bound ClpP family serine protease
MEQSTTPEADLPEPEVIDLSPEPEVKSKEEDSGPTAKPQVLTWPMFLANASPQEVKDRFAKEAAEILKAHGLEQTCCLAILEPTDSIDSYDLDEIFRALNLLNPAHDKDVILFLLSPGGAGEPAYQISKLCKAFAKSTFKVVVPRFAKSAATLIAIGADEIHMGPLGQLGPIDPQIGGLPALGVSRALMTIASVAARYPKSAEMLARYLQLALTVEQIGYCDRIADSAMQYAERLLSTKPKLVQQAAAIAKELVHEYKDHNFVIDLDEAQKHLGSDWIKTGTTELRAAEALYTLLDLVNFFYGHAHSKKILVTGGVALPNSLLILDKKA